MRPAHPNMYGQPAYALQPQNSVQYYASNCPPGNSPLPQYGRNPQDAQPQLQPVYLVHQQPAMAMHQYPAVVGVPTQVMGNPIPQPMVIQGVPGYGVPQGWAYSPAMVEPQSSAPVWGYGPDRSRGYNEQPQEVRVQSNWQRAPPQGHPGNGAGAPGSFQGRVEGHANGVGGHGSFQGRAEGHGNGAGGPGSFQGRAEGHGNGAGGPGNFQGRSEAHGNGAGGHGSFQGRAEAHGNVQSFGKIGGEVRRPDRGFESSSGSRYHSSGALGRQHMNRQGPPPQSPAPSQVKQLNCEPCEKTFAVPSQYTAHMNTHVQCDDIGCSFSASGKVVKEHKQTAHSKSSNPNPMSALKAARKLSEEDNDEIRAWREERKRNYPTRSNIQRKKEALEGKVARGELIDEDAKQRRQRMKEILTKQAELGVPVAEVPAYYLSQQKDDRVRGRKISTVDGSSASVSGTDSKKRKLGEDADVATGMDDQPSKSARADTDPSNGAEKVVAQAETDSDLRHEDNDEAGSSKPASEKSGGKTQCYFYQRGRCKKGSKCHFAHTGPRGKKGGDGEAGKPGQKAAVEKKRPPTLLSKLLQADVTRDKSHILQCLRHFVNNNFLLDWPNQPSQSVQLPVESDAAEDSSDYSEGEVVEAPDVLLADTAIINTLLSERPDVLAKVIEMESEA